MENEEQLKEEMNKYYACDLANVMMIGVIKNYDDEKSDFWEFGKFKFLRDNGNIRVLYDLKKDRVEIWKNNEKWTMVSKELYDLAEKVISIWHEKPILFINENKDNPILLADGKLGIVVAPRVEAED